MKKGIKSLLLVSLLGSLTAGAGAWQQIQKTKTIQVATDGNFAPFNFFKGTKLTGYEVELAEALAKKMGLKIKWKNSPFDSLLIGLAQHRYDLVISSHGVTEERAKIVNFTNPHYCTGVVMVNKKNGPQRLLELKGKKAAIQVGTIFAPSLMKVPGIREVVTFRQDTDCMQALIANRVEAWLTDEFVAKAAVKANPDKGMEVQQTVLTEKVAMAVNKEDSELLQKVNEALRAIQKDGTVKKISEKYFERDISCPETP